MRHAPASAAYNASDVAHLIADRPELDAAQFDDNLRLFMQKVYGLMTAGILLSAIVAWLVGSHSGLFPWLLGPGKALRVSVMILPILFVGAMTIKPSMLPTWAMHTLFWSFCVTLGVSSAWIFYFFDVRSIERVFFIGAAMFAGACALGVTLDKRMWGAWPYFLMLLIGFALTFTLNSFLWQSTTAHYWICGLGVILFSNLAIWATQAVMEMYGKSYAQEEDSKLMIVGALLMYLIFINIFQLILLMIGKAKAAGA